MFEKALRFGPPGVESIETPMESPLPNPSGMLMKPLEKPTIGLDPFPVDLNHCGSLLHLFKPSWLFLLAEAPTKPVSVGSFRGSLLSVESLRLLSHVP